MLELITKNI